MEPFIEWYEAYKNIHFKLDYSPITKHEINIHEDSIDIYFEIGNDEKIIFEKKIVLNAMINKEKSFYEVKGQQNTNNKIIFTLEKKFNLPWNNLSKEKDNKIKIDWANWKYIEDEPDNSIFIPKLQTKDTISNHFELSDSDSE